MSSQHVIWCNQELSSTALAELTTGVSDARLIFAEEQGGNLSAGGAHPALAEADIAFGQPDADQVRDLPNLKWIQLTSAGYTRYDRQDLRDSLRARGAILTNSSSVYDQPCAEHVLAFMLSQSRQLAQAVRAQFTGKGWDFDGLRPATRLLADQTVIIVGFGAIASRLVELLQPFKLTLIGVRQTVRGDEPIKVHPISDLGSLLPDADHVVNILPASDTTNHLFDSASFDSMKPGAVFYNIGRGSTVVQEALSEALNSGKLTAAYLDVTDPEPLPIDHPLWRTENCFITPHIAGGHDDETKHLVHHFLENLRRLDRSEHLNDRIV